MERTKNPLVKKSKRIHLKTRERKFTVYLLYSNDEVVYVGKSFLSAEGRVQHHIDDPEKMFDSYELIECESEQEMNIVEANMIFEYVPKYNRQLPTKHAPNLAYIGLADYDNTKLEIDGIVLNGKLYIRFKPAKKQ